MTIQRSEKSFACGAEDPFARKLLQEFLQNLMDRLTAVLRFHAFGTFDLFPLLETKGSLEKKEIGATGIFLQAAYRYRTGRRPETGGDPAHECRVLQPPIEGGQGALPARVVKCLRSPEALRLQFRQRFQNAPCRRGTCYETKPDFPFVYGDLLFCRRWRIQPHAAQTGYVLLLEIVVAGELSSDGRRGA